MLVLLFYTNLFITIATGIEINVNLKNPSIPFKHFWRSTGFCPPDPKSEIYKFLISDDEKLNLALIGGLPNRAIKQVRIHWLLNLIAIKYSKDTEIYDFHKLDSVLDWIYEQKLYLGFEIMGVPQLFKNDTNAILKYNEIFLKTNVDTYQFWYNLVLQLAKRYIDRFGISYMKRWHFETWNEPDLKNYNVLNFTVHDYLTYVQACADGLNDALKPEPTSEQSLFSTKLKFGGPAGLFMDPKNHPLCWGLLRNCNNRKWHTCSIQFISFHKKGEGTADQVLNKGLQLLDLLYSKFPNIRRIPVSNDEADILTNWSKSEEWRGDTRYAAMIVQVIIDHFKKILMEMNIKIEVLSNDNAFLNYHPFYFTQRTLLTRFQMNNTNPPHVQFIKKPAYSVMALLSLLGDGYIKENISIPDPLVKSLATKSGETRCTSATASLLITYVNNTEESNDDKTTTRTIKVLFSNLQTLDGKYTIYVLNNHLTNPFLLWKDAGSPVFPERTLRERMREVEEPFRLLDPSPIVNSTLEVQMNLTLPSVALVHICSRSFQPPGRVTHLKVYNVTLNEVLLIWKDTNVNCKCIRTYEVEFQLEIREEGRIVEGSTKFHNFRRINLKDTIFLSYHHVATGTSQTEATRGRYRVRAVDYWNRPGRYSKVLVYPSN